MNPVIRRVTERIIERSQTARADYLARMALAGDLGPSRSTLSCSNLAHGIASCQQEDKSTLRLTNRANIAIVSAYNEMLSAHQPYANFPEQIRQALQEVGSVSQFAGGVPAMCDGITQGQEGMELSLFSRDVIAMSTAIALSHKLFDGALCLGICDKIVPGLLIGALSFGHLPTIFVPAGPMASGLGNEEKARVRQLFAAGKVDRETLLETESQSYHSPGTCTFYGTANSNQVLMEVMGLQLPGSSFIHPGTPLRENLTQEAARQVNRITALGDDYRPLGKIVDEKCLCNAMVALLATGGSSNHTMHLVAIARAAGIAIDWDDFSELSTVTPLLTRIYPNGSADINHFQAAGGVPLLINELLQADLLHPDVTTIRGQGLNEYIKEPRLKQDKLSWTAGPRTSLDTTVIRPASDPFSPQGGLQLLQGNLGRGIIKLSAVKTQHQKITAPAIIFSSQEAVKNAFDLGQLNRDCVVVVRFQGPKANGMPELHKLTPYLGVLQEQGYKVALITDGRMSGASGKVPAAIQLTPEAKQGGPIAKLQDGDIIRLDSAQGLLEVVLGEESLARRVPQEGDLAHCQSGCGRELFANMRQQVSSAEQGASVLTARSNV